MQTLKKYFLIIGLTLVISAYGGAENTHAIYSPTLSGKATSIKQDILSAQQKNGKGSLIDVINKVLKYDDHKRTVGWETGIPGDAVVAQKLVLDNTLGLIFKFPWDPILMIFNFNSFRKEFISECLRDDIWALELLRDAVAPEMIKAYILLDAFNAEKLRQDYMYLIYHIDLLRKFGSDPTVDIPGTTDGKGSFLSSNKYFFGTEHSGKNTVNYYVNQIPENGTEYGCPYSAFGQAFEQVGNSSKNFLTMITFKGFKEWGSIWAMAQKNARIRAGEWIRANQITLTLGGEAGGNPRSLIKGGGWDEFVGGFKTQWTIIKNMVGPVTPLFDKSLYQRPAAVKNAKVGQGPDCVYYYHEEGKFQDCSKDQIEQYDKCKDDKIAAEKKDIRCDRFADPTEIMSLTDRLNRQIALQDQNAKTIKDATNTFVYSMSLDSVAEQNIYFIDDAMWELNKHIQRGTEDVDAKAGKGIPSLKKKIAAFVAKVCANKVR